MDSTQTLELQIKSKSQEAKNSVDSLVKSLTGIENVLTNIYTRLGNIEKKSNTSVNKTISDIDELKSRSDKATNSINKLSKSLTLSGTYVAIKRFTGQFLDWMNEAVDYTEQLNLFNVVFKNIEKDGVQTFSTLGKEAIQFQYRLNEAFGTNKTQTFYMQGIFQSMGESVGIPDTYSAIMSETMTKLSYDLASLYNKTEKDTAEAIRAGVYAGQTKPLRSYGIDVTQQTLQPILESLGIDDRTVKQMTQAEKEILRYIATMKQAKVAMGDLANTIESPSNQLKVFRQQLVETKVALSSLFMGTFANVLPYFNAFLMVVKEVTKSLADMFGIELIDYNSGIASQEDAYVDLEDSIDGAVESAKELKRQTLGFDQINNINENKDSGSGNGSNLIDGIDQRLLDAIKGYDNGMESVRMKATQIRDNIMEWLGFTKEIDPLTGEVSFKYEGINKTLGNIWKSFMNLNTQGKILVGIGLYALVSKLLGGTKKLTTALGAGTGLLGVTKKLLSPMKSLYKSLDNVNYYNKSLTQGLKEGITNWSKSLTMADRFKVSLIGILGLSTSMSGMASAMKSVSDEGWNMGNSLQAAASGFGSIASGAYIGSIFGPLGTAIGGATGALLALISAIDGYETASEKMIEYSENELKASEERLQSYHDTKKAIEETMNTGLAQTEYHEKLLDELGLLVDANGNVKKGYEDRVNFILNELNQAYGTEYSIIDGTIDGYKNLNDTIKQVIQSKRAEIYLEAERENYIEAIKNQSNAWKEYNDSIIEYNKNNEIANEIISKKNELESLMGTNAFRNYKYYSQLTKETYVGMNAYRAITNDLETYNKVLEDNQITIDNNRKVFEEYTNDIVFYEDLQTAVLTENTEEQNRLIEERMNTITTANGKEKLSLEEQLQFYEDIGNQRLEILKNNGKEITEEIEQQAFAQKQSIIDSLVEQSQTVEGLSSEVIDTWKYLAENSVDEFVSNFSKLPDEIQTELAPKLQLTGETLSEILSANTNFNGIGIFKGWNTAIEKIYNIADKILPDSILGFKLPSLSSLKIPIRAYANGGFPEDGLFFANHNELLGKFNNGKTAVANNLQIQAGIEEASYRGYMRAIQDSGMNINNNQIDVHVHTDEGTVIDRIEQKVKQTGVFPFTIPT